MLPRSLAALLARASSAARARCRKPAGRIRPKPGAHLDPELGTVLAAGGYNYNVATRTVTAAELYRPATKRWSPGGTMITGRNAHTATLLASGAVLATGGNNPTRLSSSELYDPASKAWSLDATMSAARDWHTATRLKDGRVLVAGGLAYLTTLASAELYTPTGTAPSCTIHGTNHDDLLVGSSAGDGICGRGGDDTIDGRTWPWP